MTTTGEVYRALHTAVERVTGCASRSTGTDIIEHAPAFRRWAWLDEETGRVAVSRKRTDDCIREALDARIGNGPSPRNAGDDAFVHALDAVLHAEVLALYREAPDEPEPHSVLYQTGSFTVVNGAVLAVADLIRESVYQDPELARLWPDLAVTARIPYMADAEAVMVGICSSIAQESGTTVLSELTRLLVHPGAKIPYLVLRLADAFGVSIVPGSEANLQIDAIEQVLLRAIGSVEAAVRYPGGPATDDGSYGRAAADRCATSVQSLIRITTPLPAPARAVWTGTAQEPSPSSRKEAPSIAGTLPSFEDFLERSRKAVEELFGAHVHVRTYVTDSAISPLRDRLRGSVVLGRYRYGTSNGGELTLDVKRTTRPIRSFLKRVKNTPVQQNLPLRNGAVETYREALATVLHEHIHALGPDDSFAMHDAMNRALHGGRVIDEGLTELATSVFMVDFLRALGIAGLHEDFQQERSEGNYPAETAFVREIVGYLAERYTEDPRAILKQLVTVGSEHGPLQRMAYLMSYARPVDTHAARDVAAGIMLRHARRVEHVVSRKNDLSYRKLQELGRVEGKLCVGELVKSLTALSEQQAARSTIADSGSVGLGAA